MKLYPLILIFLPLEADGGFHRAVREIIDIIIHSLVDPVANGGQFPNVAPDRVGVDVQEIKLVGNRLRRDKQGQEKQDKGVKLHQ